MSESTPKKQRCDEPVSSIDYRILDEDDIASVTELLCREFTLREPLNAAVELSAADFEVVAKASAVAAASSKLSFVAVETTSQKIIGAITCSDRAAPSSMRGVRTAAAFGAIAALLYKMDLWFVDKYRPLRGYGNVLAISMVVCDSSYSGRGIAARLVQHAVKHARAAGFKLALSMCTGICSQKVHSKSGFRSVFAVPYAEYQWQQKTPFACAASVHKEAQLMVCDLSQDKDAPAAE